MSDTVGFIDRLPHALVAAFRATLEEVAEADLVLHVIDGASPERERHVAAVRRVLEEVGAADVPVIDVYNKVDMLSADEQRRLQIADPAAALISARTGPAWPSCCRWWRRGWRSTPGALRSHSTAAPTSIGSRRSRLYRIARVISHVDQRTGRSSSRRTSRGRFIERLTTPAPQENSDVTDVD